MSEGRDDEPGGYRDAAPPVVLDLDLDRKGWRESLLREARRLVAASFLVVAPAVLAFRVGGPTGLLLKGLSVLMAGAGIAMTAKPLRRIVRTLRRGLRRIRVLGDGSLELEEGKERRRLPAGSFRLALLDDGAKSLRERRMELRDAKGELLASFPPEALDEEALRSLLAALGSPVRPADDLEHALRERFLDVTFGPVTAAPASVTLRGFRQSSPEQARPWFVFAAVLVLFPGLMKLVPNPLLGIFLLVVAGVALTTAIRAMVDGVPRTAILRPGAAGSATLHIGSETFEVRPRDLYVVAPDAEGAIPSLILRDAEERPIFAVRKPSLELVQATRAALRPRLPAPRARVDVPEPATEEETTDERSRRAVR
ncbi:MAG: hypothetical protein AAGH15_12895 [Myxococcota bacterium]